MPARRLRISLLIAALAVVAAVAAVDAHAAAPRYVLVTGPSLQRPVVLGDWSENLAFLLDLLPARRPAPGWHTDRPRYKLALFWGVPAKPVPRDPRNANQFGWFYPAANGRRAVVVLLVSGRDGPRIATRKALRILRSHGVPTRAAA
jgi:hypothetical protein